MLKQGEGDKIKNSINMKEEKQLTIFEGRKVRRVWDEKKEKWYFSVVDIIQILVDQPDYREARNYWKVLKNRLKLEGSQLVTNCNQLKMMAADGKFYDTDVADVEMLLRLIQTIPSKKVEPIKLWLARVGYERMVEINDPEKALNRSRVYWQRRGWRHFVPPARVTFGRPKVTKSRRGYEFAWEAQYAWGMFGRTPPRTPWNKLLCATKILTNMF